MTHYTYSGYNIVNIFYPCNQTTERSSIFCEILNEIS